MEEEYDLMLERRIRYLIIKLLLVSSKYMQSIVEINEPRSDKKRKSNMERIWIIVLYDHGRLAWEEEKKIIIKAPERKRMSLHPFNPNLFPSPSPKDSRSAQRYLLNHLVAVYFCGTARLRIREGKEVQEKNLLFTQRKK